MGKRKIHVCASNQGGNRPAEACWDAMSNADNKSQTNGSFSVSAMMGNKNGKIQWIYEVKEG